VIQLDTIVGLIVNYTHPAFTSNFIINKPYQVSCDDKGYFVLDCLDYQRYYELAMIKTLFSPLGTSWEELDKPNKKAKELKLIIEPVEEIKEEAEDVVK